MRTQPVWSDAVPDHEGKKQIVWDLCYKPDGTLLVVAVGQRLVLYNADDGDMRYQKIAHQADIYTVSPNKDGTFIASGGADKSVSVWTYELSQKYTYTHAESVQNVNFNPVAANILASCSNVDFAIWTIPNASLRKIKVGSKILSSAWTSDGQYLAIGMLNGQISLRDLNGIEKLVIERNGSIWDLCWLPSKLETDPYDNLAVACWDGTLSFYQLTGHPIGKERTLGYDPCSVRLYNNGDYILVSGSDRKATLMTRDGIKLNTVGESKDWIWRAIARPRSSQVALATNDGKIMVQGVTFSTVHGLYQDRYAFRENMTDVIVQHLVTEQRVRIKCRDYVKKIALYKDRLAVQLPDRILIYEVNPDKNPSTTVGSSSPLSSSASSSIDTTDLALSTSLMYQVKDKIMASLDCNLLVVTSAHVILCLEKKLQLYNFQGTKVREWVLEAVIRYIKVIGGPAGGEGLLVGLKNGIVLKIYVDNPFPMQLIKHRNSIRCLDLSTSRRKLAVVDDQNICVVYDIVTGDQILSEAGANSVAWNAQMEDMLCFSGNGMLSIKTGTFPLHQQKLSGFVVGFTGSKIFCLQSTSMLTIDVPQSASLYRYIEEKDWSMAYRVACLGVTDSDWRTLGDAALRALELSIARVAFVRLKDMRYIELINYIETAKKGRRSTVSTPDDDAQYLAEVMAYTGKYQEAAKLHVKAGTIDKAVEMFTDMRLWNEARKFAEESGRVDVSSLMLKQAAWCEDNGDITAAATIYAGLGMATRAVHLLGERNLFVQLVELVRTFTLPNSKDNYMDSNNGSGTEGNNPTSNGTNNDTVNNDGSGTNNGTSSNTKDITEALIAASDYFRKADLVKYAREVYVKLNDQKALLQLHIDALEWEEALNLARRADSLQPPSSSPGSTTHPNADTNESPSSLPSATTYVNYVHLCRAEWLATEDRFEEAQEEYELAGHPELAVRILEHLAINAIDEERYEDTAVNYYRLAMDMLSSMERLHNSTTKSTKNSNTSSSKSTSKILQDLTIRYRYYLHVGDIYRAYHVIHTYLSAPFTSASAETIFQAARFIVNACFGPVRNPFVAPVQSTNSRLPYGISITRTLLALGRQGINIQAYRSTRIALDCLHNLMIPHIWRDTVDLLALSIQSKPTNDREDLVPICLRCGGNSPVITASVLQITIPPTAKPRLPPYRYHHHHHHHHQSTRTGIKQPTTTAPSEGSTISESLYDPIFTTTSYTGDACASCGQTIIRSALTYEPLPIIEFIPSNNQYGKAIELLKSIASGSNLHSDNSSNGQENSNQNNSNGKGTKTGTGGMQTLTFDTTASSTISTKSTDVTGEEGFAAILRKYDSTNLTNDTNNPNNLLTIPLDILKGIDPSSVFITRAYSHFPSDILLSPSSLSIPEQSFVPPRFFKNMIPEIAITMCPWCCHFFHAEDYEFECLKHGYCPVCHIPPEGLHHHHTTTGTNPTLGVSKGGNTGKGIGTNSNDDTNVL